MVIKNVFTEFFTLSYSKGDTIIKNLKDVKLSDFVILRMYGTVYRIHYLSNGNTIEIPLEWIDIFSSLDVFSGARILNAGETEFKYFSDIEKTIYYWLLLIHYIHSDPDKVLPVLANICNLGTEKFRTWLDEEFGKKLDPVKFNTVDKYLII